MRPSIRPSIGAEEIDNKQEYIFKGILIGNAGVGKTSILLRYTKSEFADEYKTTIGAEFGSKTMDIDENNRIRLQIWDTAGQESFHGLVKSFYRDAAAIFLVYNVTKRETFKDLANWMTDIKECTDENTILVLMGNHADIPHKREVSYDEGLKFMQDEGCHFFFETSAKEGTNIDLAFGETVKLAYMKQVQDKLDRDGFKQRDTIRLTVAGSRKKNAKTSCNC